MKNKKIKIKKLIEKKRTVNGVPVSIRIKNLNSGDSVW